MVFKLPSARCLSKASRDGALSENMANADINASLKGISTSSTRSSAMVAKFSRSKRKSASAQRCLRPFGTTMDIATLNLTSSTGEIVPMRIVLWPSCLRKARGDAGVVTGIYRPPGIAALICQFRDDAVALLACQQMLKTRGLSHDTLTQCEPLLDTMASVRVRQEFARYLHHQLATATRLGLADVGLPIS